MMTTLLSVLGGRFGGLLASAAGILLTLAISAAGIQSLRLAHAKSDLTATRADLKTAKEAAATANSQLGSCAADRTSLRAAVTAQNIANENIRQQSEHTAAQLAAQLSQANAAVAESDRRLRSLQTHQITGKDACARLLDVDRAIVAGG